MPTRLDPRLDPMNDRSSMVYTIGQEVHFTYFCLSLTLYMHFFFSFISS